MDKLEELDLFTAELFKRPLVVQPSAHIGRGLAAISCTMFTKEGEPFTRLLDMARSLPSQHVKAGHHWPISKMPFKWHFACVQQLPEIEPWQPIEFLI